MIEINENGNRIVCKNIYRNQWIVLIKIIILTTLLTLSLNNLNLKILMIFTKGILIKNI